MADSTIIYFLISFIVCLFITSICFNFLKRKKRFDANLLGLSKSSNVVTSLGISFLICFFVILSYFVYEKSILEILPNKFYIFFISLIFLTIISYRDDYIEIDPKIRLIVQLVIVYFSLTNLDLRSSILPLKLSIFLALVFWVYIINVVNFIDGSDGHCAIHSISFFIGTLYISYFFQLESFSKFLAYINLPIIFVFLLFNFPVAKAYMGDTGSIFIGYIIGFILLENILLHKGLYILSVFLYPIMDCTITLVKKMFKGYYPWAKLGDYFFLIPVKNGYKIRKVFFAALIYNIFNLLFLFLIINYSDLFFILNVLNSLTLILYFRSYEKKEI